MKIIANINEIIPILNKYKVILFDFDGTLMNTEPYHLLAHEKTFSKILNRPYKLSKAVFDRYIGKNDYTIFSMVKEDFGVDFNLDKIVNFKVDNALETLLNCDEKIYPYYEDLRSELKDVKFYILTNQAPKIVEQILISRGIYNDFENIFSLFETRMEKSEFIDNIQKFCNCKKEEAVIFEDSATTLKTCKHKGLLTIGIQNPFNVGKITECDYFMDMTRS